VDVEGHQEPSYRLYNAMEMSSSPTLLGGPPSPARYSCGGISADWVNPVPQRAILVATAGTAAVLVLVLTAEASGMNADGRLSWVELTFSFPSTWLSDRGCRVRCKLTLRGWGDWSLVACAPSGAGGLAILLVVIRSNHLDFVLRSGSAAGSRSSSSSIWGRGSSLQPTSIRSLDPERTCSRSR